MTRFEYLKSLPVEKAAQYLCRSVEEISNDYPCDHCPLEKFCNEGKNGWGEWLKGEA